MTSPRLDDFPNVARAKSFREYSLNEARSEFKGHLHSGEPCVIRGGAAHWPALSRWKDLRYWQEAALPKPVELWRAPYSSAATHSTAQAEMTDAHVAVTEVFTSPLTYARLFLLIGEGSAFRVASDIEPFSFAPEWASKSTSNYRRPHYYHPQRLFLHQKSYTDWHYHQTDDHLTVQISGRKTFLLLPPTMTAWNLTKSIFAKASHWEPSFAWEGFSDVCPYRVEMTPGDILFIPPFWQHAAESVETGEIGATLACTFRTPAHRICPLSNPYVRSAVRSVGTQAASTWGVREVLTLLAVSSFSTLLSASHRFRLWDGES